MALNFSRSLSPKAEQIILTFQLHNTKRHTHSTMKQQ